MNKVWSDYVQGCNTLYYSRKLRFDDRFFSLYEPLFALECEKPLKILEIGCGPGALAGALRRMYPNARIVAIDRDSEFIAFAREKEKGIEFIEGDATALPFADGEFDVTISNTVSEHIAPALFLGEQYRVLKNGGRCIVLSSRKGIVHRAECLDESEYEAEFWKKAAEHDRTHEVCRVCQYPMNERELPQAFEKYGFSAVSTGYALIDLTPDDPKYDTELALQMIEAERLGELDSIISVEKTMGEHFAASEIEKMTDIINAKYDARVRDYTRGVKLWDTNMSLIMVIRGDK